MDLGFMTSIFIGIYFYEVRQHMDLFDSINRRKSCRKYSLEPLSDVQLEEIEAVLHSFEPLFEDVPLSYRFVKETKGMFHVLAPHYLIISGPGQEGEPENAGFIGQQLTLWLNHRGLGSVWLGASRDASTSQKRSDIIIIALGKPETSPYRELSEFRRKDISEITNAVDDKCIQAVHLAPSGLNVQPWYFEKTSDKLLIYRQILKPPISLAYKLTQVDMGIALSHYMIACKHYHKPFKFRLGGQAESKKGYKYFGYIDLSDG